ncbi:MAG TPA: hypothetical protein VHG30_04695 [Microvirga sp.]|nr:hypothetical protein [Microvirga sp.]
MNLAEPIRPAGAAPTPSLARPILGFVGSTLLTIVVMVLLGA